MKELQTGEKRKIQCRSCKRITNHILLYQNAWSEQHSDFLNYWLSINQLFQCLGCNAVCLSISGCFDADRDSETGDYIVEESFFPDPHQMREELRSWVEIPKKIRSIYGETIKAVNTRLPLLASVGVGSIIEAICNDKDIRGSLKTQIDALVENGLVTQDGAKLLHIAREYRNMSAHEHEPMSERQLQLCMDVIDGMLRNIYIFPQEFELFNAGKCGK